MICKECLKSCYWRDQYVYFMSSIYQSEYLSESDKKEAEKHYNKMLNGIFYNLKKELCNIKKEILIILDKYFKD